MVGGVALFSDVSPTSGSRPLPHSCALQTGLGILAELETAESAHLPSGPGISPDTHITLSARLASLFGRDQAAADHGNEFFQYTAPKQPKKGQGAAATGNQAAPKTAPTSTGTSTVLVATVVHAYRYTNGQYVKQGKFGAAVLGNHTAREYRILLYISQQQPVTVAKIHLSFELMVRPNNYSTFYDDQRQNWSIMFESEKAAVEFNKQVCIAKCNSTSSLDAVLSQDLIVTEGTAVEVGDSLEVAYTSWLFQNHALGQVFDSTANKDKLLRLKLGSGKVIKGWEDGMLGMKKGGRRLLIIPPTCAVGSEGVIGWTPSTDSVLVFEVEIRRVKFARDSGSDGQSVSSRDSAAPSPIPGADSLPADPVVSPPTSVPFKEPTLRIKSNSLSEQLTVNTNPDTVKAKLISRMAKMGQPMLPIFPPQLDSNDSEIEEVNALRGAGQPVPPPSIQPSLQPAQPVLPQVTTHAPQPSVSGLQAPSAALMQVAPLDSHSSAVSGNSQSFQPYAGMPAYGYPQAPTVSSQLQPVRPLYPAPLSQPPHFQGSGDMASFLMTEARQHNTEIRMAVSKVADKMDYLMTKVEELQKHSAGNSLLIPSVSVTMETRMIMSNIQRIIQENERLKQEILEKSSRIEEQNDKISELIERNQRYVEQSNLMMEKRNNSLQTATENTQARVLHAEQEKAKVTEELAAATAQVSHLQLKMTAHQKKETELQMQLTESLKETDLFRGQLTKLQAELSELQETSEQAQSRFKSEKQSRKQLELKVTALEEELADLRAEKESLEKNLSERKKKSAQERCQAEEEMDEIRKSYQEELDKLRQLLKKARVSTDQAASEQLSLVQAELQTQWEAKCEHLLASAKDEHLQQYQEVCAQRDASQQKLLQLQEKCLALQAQVTTLTEQKEIEKNKSQMSGVEVATDSSEKVKKIMNQVFQSLRGEFELEESYNGRTILGTIMNTIKMVTLQLLNQHEPETGESSNEDEEEQEEEQPQSPSQEQSVSASSEPSQAPLSRERQESPLVQTEQVVKEAGPLPPQALLTPQEDAQRREGKSTEAEVLAEIKDDSLPPILACIPPHRALGPPTSVPPEPPGPITVDSEFEETLAASPLGNACVGERESSTRLSLTLDPKKGDDPLSLEPESPGGEPQPPEFKKEEDVTSSAGPSKELSSTEAGSVAAGAALGPNHSSQHSSLSGDEEDELFKGATLKVPKSKAQSEEEDEDEVSMKGRPPPTPLFGDDDDDDDIDWLG
ncbi:FK506-binding protein 15 isoform X2 [Myotis daubentonii]|uniref:FK506-binding protein 15 isoform X2 n=1 Tax=Myotis daubentonii TaxID=98922 RepID=UPI0028739A93|nr:FK506-binding protein 15 isoform X2 [Myotis daubentonii]